MFYVVSTVELYVNSISSVDRTIWLLFAPLMLMLFVVGPNAAVLVPGIAVGTQISMARWARNSENRTTGKCPGLRETIPAASKLRG